MKGAIVLVSFPFSDLSGKKVRPACILADDGRDVTLAFISSVIKNQGPFDLVLKPDKTNNLKKESLLKTSKIATLSKSIIHGKIGYLKPETVSQMNVLLIKYLKLS